MPDPSGSLLVVSPAPAGPVAETDPAGAVVAHVARIDNASNDPAGLASLRAHAP